MSNSANGRRSGGFTQISNELLRDKTLSPSAKLLYAVGATYLKGGAGSIYPSYATLAEECGFSRRTAIRAAQQLVDRGLWRIERRRKDEKSAATNLITYLQPSDKVTFSPEYPSDKVTFSPEMTDTESPNQKGLINIPPVPPKGGSAHDAHARPNGKWDSLRDAFAVPVPTNFWQVQDG